MPSGGTAALVGATHAVAQGGYVTDLAAWHRLGPALRQQFERELVEASAGGNTSACLQRASLKVGVSPPGPAVRLVSDVLGGGLPAGCHGAARGTTECDTLYGFGAGSTPFTVTGQIAYAGTPVCVSYGAGGQLCSGWFGAWGANGTTTTGATGSGIGASTLAVVAGGDVRAQAVSTPSALYVSRAPSGDQSSVTVTPVVTLLDVTVQSMADSAQCAPTTLSYGVVTPNVSTPSVATQQPVSCVDEVAFDGRGDAAATGSAASLGVRAAQRALTSPTDSSSAVAHLVPAATQVQDALAATSHAGLFSAGRSTVGSATVLASACPALNDALAAGTRAADAFTCTQSTLNPMTDTVLGQSLVSTQLTATAGAESTGPGGEAHLLLALDTVEVHECWPAAACG
jgi:hypothetical protein